jgi:hypothetical protein
MISGPIAAELVGEHAVGVDDERALLDGIVAVAHEGE